MTRPGERLRTLATHLLPEGAMTRVIDPAVADLQAEHAGAAGRGPRRHTAWVLARGYGSLAAALLAQGTLEVWRACRVPSPDDRTTAARLVFSSTVLLLIVTGLFAIHPMMPLMFSEGLPANRYWLVAMLIPQALPLAIPVALTLGAALVLRRRRTTAPVVVSVLVLALGGSALSFSVLAWAAPAANQVFRVGIAGPGVVHDKGNAELMLGELRRLAQHGDPRDVRTRYSYQLRYALPFAPLALALVVVGVLPRANQTASLRMAMAAILCGGYYVLLMAGTMTLAQGTATAVVSAAWLPNVACVLLAGVVLTARLARLAGDPPQMVARMTP